MSRPYAFDDEDNDFTQSQQSDGDAAFKPMDIQKPRGFDDVKAGANSEFRAFGESAKKLTTAADAIKAAVESLKSGLEDALIDKTGIPAVKTDTTGSTLDDVVDAIKNIKLAPADNKFDGPKSSKPDRSEPKLQQAQNPRPIPVQPKEFQTPGLKPVEPREFAGPELAKMQPREFAGPELTAEPPAEKLTPPVLQKREVEKPTFPENAKSEPREFKTKEPEFSSHGLIPGKETTQDRVNVKAKSGEFIVRPEAVKAIGLRKLEEFNSLKQKPPEFHARGGLVGKDRPAVAFKSPERQPKAYSVGGIVANAASGVMAGYAASHNEGRPREIGASIISGAYQGGLAGGPLGAATGAVVAGFKSVAESAKASSDRLNGFSAGLSAAKGREEQRQAIGDIRRAQFLDPELSRFTDAQSKFDQTQQNVQAALMKPLLDSATTVITMFDEFTKSATATVLAAEANICDAIGDVLKALYQSGAAKSWKDTAENTRRAAELLARNEKDGGESDPIMQDFLAGFGGELNPAPDNGFLAMAGMRPAGRDFGGGGFDNGDFGGGGF